VQGLKSGPNAEEKNPGHDSEKYQYGEIKKRSRHRGVKDGALKSRRRKKKNLKEEKERNSTNGKKCRLFL